METIRNNLATLVVGAVVAACLVAAFALLGPWQASNSSALVAVVHDADGVEKRLPLSQNTTLEVQTSLGRNVIVVKDGAAFVQEADCPRGTCTHQRPISQVGEQIVCLPHELWVEIVQGDGDTSSAEKTTDVDLVAR